MSWALVADSSCNLRAYQPVSPDAVFRIAPLKISVAGREFVDDEHLDAGSMNKAMELADAASSSSCPSVGEWAEHFRCAQNVIAITISSQLSGSYEAALMARNLVMEEYMLEHGGVIGGKNIHVLDSRAAGGKLELMVELLDRYIAAHEPSFDEAVAYLERLERRSTVLFSLCSYGNLVKGGRMPKLAGAVATKLSIRMLGMASEVGTIKVVGSTRSEKRMVQRVCDAMAEHGFHGGLVYIDHVENSEGAAKLAKAIRGRWQGSTVRIQECGGLCSYYAEAAGLIVGFEWA